MAAVVYAFTLAASTTPTIQIAPGVKLPLVSLGTGSGQHGDVANATATWINTGGKAIGEQSIRTPRRYAIGAADVGPFLS